MKRRWNLLSNGSNGVTTWAAAMLAAFAAVVSVAASSARAADSADTAAPNVARGQAIAQQVCAACHMANGNSVNPLWPKLAGQHAEYLVKQLKDFKPQHGKPAARPSDTMSAFASALSDADMRDVAAWFASQTIAPGAAHDAHTVPLGQRIWRAGIAERGVPACAGCHGPTGQGIPVEYPRLSGQWADYLAAQLSAFSRNARANNEPMHQIAHRLSDEEIKAVADYAAGLH